MVWGNGMLSVQEDARLCAVISSSDGRWRAVSCDMDAPSACRKVSGGWSLGKGQRGVCPDGSVFELPHHSKENLLLQSMLQQSGASAAWLPLEGGRLFTFSFSLQTLTCALQET